MLHDNLLVCWVDDLSFAFSPTLDSGLVIFEIIVEVCFGMDIILRFFHEFQDPETHEIIHDVKQISYKYVCSWFPIDLIAIIPLAEILKLFGSQENQQYAVLIKLFRIVRLPKFMRLLDTSKFDLLLDSILEKEPKNPQEEKSRQEKMNIKYISRYAYKVFRLILIALMLTYFLGSFWYFMVSIMPRDDSQPNFISKNTLDEKSNMDKLIMCCYFVLTTLSTIGYGDLSPQTNSEKILGISLMIVGIAFFSYIMGNFNDVLINYDKKMGIIDRRNDLQVWMTSLDKFSSSVPPGLLKKINNHFNFFWKHDRLSSLTPDDKYLQTMPVPLRIQLINFLFDDIFQQFRLFFFKKKFNNSPFYYEVAFLFLPRIYEPKTRLFQPGDEFHEILLQTDGEIRATLHSDPPETRFFQKGYFLGDYEVIHNKRCQFTFETTDHPVKFLALPKHKFLKILAKYPEIQTEMKLNSSELYQKQKARFISRLLKTVNEARQKKRDEGQTGPHTAVATKEDIVRIYEEAALQRKKAPKDGEVLKAAEDEKQSLRVYPKPKLEAMAGKIATTEESIGKFEDSIKSFCGLMNKEMGDITKRLEDLKTKLIDQERR